MSLSPERTKLNDYQINGLLEFASKELCLKKAVSTNKRRTDKSKSL